MRTFKLDTDLSAIMYKVLLKGGKAGYQNIEDMQNIRPVIEKLESNFTVDDAGTKLLKKGSIIEFTVQENVFDLLKKIVGGSSGLSMNEIDRKILDLRELLNKVPSYEEKKK